MKRAISATRSRKTCCWSAELQHLRLATASFGILAEAREGHTKV